MIRPYLDPLRSELMGCARCATGISGNPYTEISITALGFADVSSIDTVWNEAQEAFDLLVIAVESWDVLAEDDEPWTAVCFPEEGVRAVGWDADRWTRCQVINILIDRVIFAGIISHLPTWTVRVEGAITVIAEAS